MLKFDFKTYTRDWIDREEFQKFYCEKEYWFQRLRQYDMTGWMEPIEEELVKKIERTSQRIKEEYDCLVVIGIGGSFLGSYAFHKMFENYFKKDSFEIIYAGTTLSDEYLEELLEYLDTKNYCLNVISKSGQTMETKITYSILKDQLKRKYSEEELKKRIIITTSKDTGSLREEVEQEGYESFSIPDNIGGRYSFLTAAHLLPLSLNYPLQEIIDGYYDGKRLMDYAFEYALTRVLLWKKNKVVENFCVYEENMSSFTEWLKQLFGETEGKNERGIYPTSSVHTRDLHSLGQFIQEGTKCIFETFIKVEKSGYYISYKGNDLHQINNSVLDSVIRAHYSGKVPCLEITITEKTPENIASLIYFFQLSAAFSALLMGVDPFNQPGVEVYKKEVRKSLGEL